MSIQQNKRPVVIGVTGGSGSGKTTVSNCFVYVLNRLEQGKIHPADLISHKYSLENIGEIEIIIVFIT